MLWVAVEEPASILLKFTALDKLVTCGVEQVQEKVKMNSGPTTTTNASFTGVFSLKTQDQVDQLVLSVKAIVEVFSLLFSSFFVSSFFVSSFFGASTATSFLVAHAVKIIPAEITSNAFFKILFNLISLLLAAFSNTIFFTTN